MTDVTSRQPITDLHTHVIPGVDDGAQELDEALDALRALKGEGVGRVVATPHFRASLLEQSAREADKLRRFDEAYDRLTRAVETGGLDIRLERGCEFKLDAPTADLSDGRLRLAGSRTALVEFASFQLPPFAGNQLRAVHEAGWIPLLAHPERYTGVTGAWDRVERWVGDGTLLQVNARSLLGWYGSEPQIAARELLRRGWVCCLASDYHARGAPDFATALQLLTRSRVTERPQGSQPAPDQGAIIDALVYANPERILSDEPTQSVSGLEVPDYDRKKRRRGWLR